MTTADYEIHLDRGSFDSLWEGDESAAPFYEDLDDIDKAIEETLGKPRPRRKPKARRN